MGYQESLVYLTPQRQFDKMVRKCGKVKQSGYYDVLGAVPLSVVTLKQGLNGMPKGTKLLWVCGDRCFHTESGVFDGKLGINGEYKLKFIPVENIFDFSESYRLNRISFGARDAPTSNEYIKRESFSLYLSNLKCRENEER